MAIAAIAALLAGAASQAAKAGFDIYDRASALSQYNLNRKDSKSLTDWNKNLSLWSAIESKKQSDWENRFSREQFEYQKSLNQTLMDREDTAFQRQVKDMQAAGINPILSSGATAQSLGATSIGAGSTPSASGASGSQASGSGASSVSESQLADIILTAQKQKDDKENAQAQYSLASQEFEETKAQNKSSSEQWKKQFALDSQNSAVDRRSTAASARAQELQNQANEDFVKKYGITYEQFSALDTKEKALFMGNKALSDGTVPESAGKIKEAAKSAADNSAIGIGKRISDGIKNSAAQGKKNLSVDSWRKHNPKAYEQMKKAHPNASDEELFDMFYAK